MNHFASRPRKSGFTLVELLVVIAIIGIMVAMALPAVNAAREAGRRATCTHHLGRLVLATHHYELANETFPSGVLNDDGPIKNVSAGRHLSWIALVLPYLDEQVAFQKLDFAAGAYDPINRPVRNLRLAAVLCPSAEPQLSGVSDFAGCHHDIEAPIDADNHGMFFLNSRVTREEMTDGAAHILFLAEKRREPNNDLGWLSGTRATLRNTGTALNEALASSDDSPESRELSVGGFSSSHDSYVVNAAFGDGAVRFLGHEVDAKLLRRLGHRSDGELVDSFAD